MSDWTERLEAVAALRPAEPKDGEVQCLNPTCRNLKLNRKDMTCWKCGWDRFAPASDEMRWALRFNYVPPPSLDPPLPGPEMPEGVGIPMGATPPPRMEALPEDATGAPPMTRRRRDAVKCLLLALTAILACTLPLWTTTGVIYALGGLVLVLGSGLVGGVLYLFVGFKRWERRIDRRARHMWAMQKACGNRRLRAITAGERDWR